MSDQVVTDKIGKVVVDALLFEVGKLDVKDGDAIVLSPPPEFNAMQLNYIADAFRRQLDGNGLHRNPMIVVPGETRLGVLSVGEPWWRRIFKR